MDALTYNRQQHLETKTIRALQQTVGASPDGKWGRQTVRLLCRWQQGQGLQADGKIGPATLNALRDQWRLDREPQGDEALDDADPNAGDSAPHDGHDELESEQDLFPLTVEGMDEPPDTGTVTELRPGDAGPAVAAFQNDLFALGFAAGRPDATYGPTFAKAVAAFQTAAATPDRIAQCRRTTLSPEVCFQGDASGRLDGATQREIKRWKSSGWRWQAPGAHHVERRVRVADLGSMPRSSAHLAEIDGVAGKQLRLHHLAAKDYRALVDAANKEAGLDLRACSAWRPHRWKSKAEYDAFVTKEYGSVREGRKWLAYSSPHETGLCIDFGSEGLEPKRKTVSRQRATAAYAWLVDNAYRFGWTPYKREPWHWEHPLSLRAWITGRSDWTT
ncbi:MAG: M15 family metallopeptidase [Myxococcales bacterium]|nr:M15 family metallopeptidase [Myxococcales bacterium]